MAQQIKIRKIEVKEGENERGHWRNIILTGEDNTKVSTFDPSASDLKEGDIIEAEIELKGKFTNLKSFRLVERSKVTGLYVDGKLVGGQQPRQRDSEQVSIGARSVRDTSIETQVAVKELGECIRAGTPVSPPLVAAYWRWVSDKLGVEPPETLLSVPESVRKAVAEANLPAIPAQGFQNIGDLLSLCASIKTASYPKGVSRQAVLDILGIKSIDDLRKLNLDGAWLNIQEYIKGKEKP